MPTITLSLDSRSYSIIVANDALDSLGDQVLALGLKAKVALISDSNVAKLYAARAADSLERAGLSMSLHLFEAGEQSKNLSTVERICNEMVAHGHDRKSLIVALGGGVVGDMAGFIASIYYRGIPFVQVPTSVMAQVDSSVGGKTAVDIDAGKNLIGAFHQPRLVLVDPRTLYSLGLREYREGVAEMIKHAAIACPEMLGQLMDLASSSVEGLNDAHLDQLPQLMAANIAIKARIVEQDEHETLGLRAFLNFGHTLGHGIEASVPYGDLLHGEVVSLGMRAALYLSCKKSQLCEEQAQRVLACLHAFGLPLELPAEVDPQLALQRCAADKKFEAGSIRFVLLRALGEPELRSDITPDDLAEAMQLLSTPYMP